MNLKQLLVTAFLLLTVNLMVKSQINLLEDWDGNGDTNTSTSLPNNYGWAVTVGTFNYANSTSGVRWYDVAPNSNPVHNLNGSAYTGRLLMVRWDGAGSTSLSSVYSYPIVLGAKKKYRFSFIYEWWNNASMPALTVSIATNKEGLNALASKSFICSSTKNLLQAGNFSFFNETAGTYYVTIKANNLAVLCGIGELSITEQPAVLESPDSIINLNYYQTEKIITVYPNGSDNTIEIKAPHGISISKTNLPSTGGQVVISSSDSSTVEGNIMLTQGTDVVTIPLFATFPSNFFNLVKIDTLNVDGAWCWFNDPRAVYYKGTREQTYFAWVNKLGDIMIAAYDHTTGAYTEKLLYPKLEVDDHDNPAIFIRKDGRLIVYFSKHTSGPAHRFISTNPEDITAWGSDYTFGENVTYPYPFQVGDEIYLFYRGLNWHPTLVVSSDNGETMGIPQQIISGGGSRPYARYCQDKTGTIHMAFTTGHPRDVANNKIYYASFKGGKFYKADGTFIKDFNGMTTALNIDKNEAETVYDASLGKGWIWDITVDENNKPVMVFASFPSDTDHRYHYARWNGTKWVLTQITNAGKWFPQTVSGGTESEPNYSGGISMDYNNPSIVYLSKQVKNSFEIFRFTTPDNGATWDSTAITWNTPSNLVNVRPVVPRNHKTGYFDLLWMRGTYVHYTNYNTSVVFYSDSVVAYIDSIALDKTQLNMKKGVSHLLNVSFYPFNTQNRNLNWSSSNDKIAEVKNGLVTATGIGTATITATSLNGIYATCIVKVEEPNYLKHAIFDFGTTSSPVSSGAIQITESTLFEDSYGWLNPVLSRDRGAVANDELRDFNMSSQKSVFKVFVEPGQYLITTKQGDLLYAHDNMSIYVNDELKVSSVSSAIGGFIEKSFEVNTKTDILEFAFTDDGGSDANWVINSIVLAKIIVDSSPKPASNNRINTESTLSVYEVSGRKVFSEKLSGREYGRVISEKMLPQGIYVIRLELNNEIKTLKQIVFPQ